VSEVMEKVAVSTIYSYFTDIFGAAPVSEAMEKVAWSPI
jgi:hypothetical protein